MTLNDIPTFKNYVGVTKGMVLELVLEEMGLTRYKKFDNYFAKNHPSMFKELYLEYKIFYEAAIKFIIAIENDNMLEQVFSNKEITILQNFSNQFKRKING